MQSLEKPLCLAIALGLCACGAPKAIVVQEAQVKNQGNVVSAPVPQVPKDGNDGFRVPDMLALPDDSQLRPSAKPPGEGASPVIVRPPSE